MEVRSNSEPIFRTTSLGANAQHKIMHTKEGGEWEMRIMRARNIEWEREREGEKVREW